MVVSATSPVWMLNAEPMPKLIIARPLDSMMPISGRGRPLRCAYQGYSARQPTSTMEAANHTRVQVAPCSIHAVVPQMSSSVAE